ncbi:hypothetical protein [Rufibacter sp. XAAS-G3-1]|nr:hypothetical protein [Rufibacter sp. XAAS-G3-1]
MEIKFQPSEAQLLFWGYFPKSSPKTAMPYRKALCCFGPFLKNHP